MLHFFLENDEALVVKNGQEAGKKKMQHFRLKRLKIQNVNVKNINQKQQMNPQINRFMQSEEETVKRGGGRTGCLQKLR